VCSFSGYKIYLGHERRYVRINGKVFQFLNAKYESAFQKESSAGKLDCPLQKKTQESIAGRNSKEKTTVQSNSNEPSLVCLLLI
jgi:large subunit ribosomal protein L24e